VRLLCSDGMPELARDTCGEDESLKRSYGHTSLSCYLDAGDTSLVSSKSALEPSGTRFQRASLLQDTVGLTEGDFFR